MLKEAILYKSNPNDSIIRCELCSNYCEILPDKTGKCFVRKNVKGKLFTYSYGASTGFAIDPIEKKPFYHFKPGSKVLSFGTPGCNFKCSNCQNWQLSHSKKSDIEEPTNEICPSVIAELAVKYKVDGIAYTYSEPTIFFEYARDTILETRNHFPEYEIFHLFISNGYMSSETLDLIEKEKLIAAINIDLKFMDENNYKKITKGKMQPVLDNILRINDMKDLIHLEVINLVIPGENDTFDDIKRLSEFLAAVNPEIPLHFSRFHPANNMKGKPPTELNTLINAKRIAKEAGLKYIYIGNTNIPNAENTYCPACDELLIERNRQSVFINLQKTKICAKCENKINIVL